MLDFGKFFNFLKVINIVGMQIDVFQVGKERKIINKLNQSVER